MKKYYSPKDLINILGLSKNTVYKYLDNDKIKSIRFWKGRYRVSAEELQRLIKIYGQKDTVPAGDASRANISIKKARQDFGKSSHANSTIIEKINNKVEEVTEVSLKKQEKTKFPNLFDWFVGLSMIWLGLSFILTPARMFSYEFLAVFRVLPIAQVVFIALGVLQIFLSLVLRRDNFWFRVIYLVEAVIFAKLTYDLIPGHNFLGLIAYGSLALVLLFSALITKTKSVTRFILLAFLATGLGGLLILILSTSSLEILGLANLSKVLGLVWLIISLSIFVLSLASIKKKTNSYFYLSIINALVFLGVSISRVSLGEWDLAMMFLLMGVFAILFPFRNQFDLGNKTRLKKNFILYFAFSTAVFAVGLFLIFGSQQLAQRDAVKKLEAQTEEVSWLLADYLEESHKEIESLSVNSVLQTAFFDKEWETVLSMIKNAHRSSERYKQIMSLDENGAVTAYYPRSEIDFNSENKANKYFFKQAKTGITYFSDLSLSTAVNSSEKEFLGVLSFNLDLEKISRILENTKVGENGFAVVIDQEGKIIHHPNQDLRLTSLDPEQFYFEDKQGNSVQMLSTNNQVEDYGWQVILLQPQSDVSQPISGLVMLIVFIEVVIFSIGLWILLRIKNKELRIEN
jgi:hypothetical protein